MKHHHSHPLPTQPGSGLLGASALTRLAGACVIVALLWGAVLWALAA